jgi:hypothetical protein
MYDDLLILTLSLSNKQIKHHYVTGLHHHGHNIDDRRL